ncbi:MAG: 5'-nucleotidase C-terminal domain-containing protein [Paludibacteraceae bacterium]|nr:5'-nucleotidase C-terminal domain-containing protein [Paludibacteraceae bacterium]
MPNRYPKRRRCAFRLSRCRRFYSKRRTYARPFGNLIWTFKLTGKQILDVIKLCKERDEGVEPYVSGMSYIMYVDKDDPNKVLEVKGLLPNGKPIKPKKVYTVAANSYTVSITDMKQYGGVETTKTSCDCMREFLSKKASVDYSNTRRTQIIKR